MFILFGLKTVVRTLFFRRGTCPSCGRYSRHDATERAAKLSLFFVPVLTFRRRYALHCSDCGYTAPLSRSELRSLERTPSL